MKLVTFSYQNQTRIGAVIDDRVVDSLGNADIPRTMIEFLSAGAESLAAMQQLINSGQHNVYC